ncbi:MAG: Asp-tRNA(Asn)/Glu-tRNA(Gln) amidotransferase subunit GatA [Anaerolineales bacterium]
MSVEICELPAYEIVARLKTGDLTAEAVLDATLVRIEAVEGGIGRLGGRPSGVHAFISLAEQRARDQARAVDRALDAGDDPGPLAGAPVAVKDIFCVSGTPSTAGSKILANFSSPYTATPVARLEAAGAITIGKVNLDEFTYGSSNESSAFLPSPRNPWSAERVPGGSSGGSAAAVAAGEAALSLGTDTSGSIRQPAAFCGIAGMKPTYGRVSRYGLIAFASSLDCPGPMARNVKDVGLMLQAMAGPDPFDATATKVPVEDYLDQIESGVRGIRIGLSPDFSKLRIPDSDTGELREHALQPEIEQALLESAERLANQGAEIVEGIDMPNVHYGIPAYFVISRVEAASNLHRYDGVKYGYRFEGETEDLFELYRKSRGQAFGLQPKLRILMGMYVSGEQYEKRYYERALRVRTLIRGDFERAFERVDAVLAPTTPTTAFEIGGLYGDSVAMQYADLLTVPANHAGIPALSVPVGFDNSGLPIGMQLMGSDFTERRLLQMGQVLEQVPAPKPPLVQELIDA